MHLRSLLWTLPLVLILSFNLWLFRLQDVWFLCVINLSVVATDDERIAECCRGFGADVIMTSESCRNGFFTVFFIILVFYLVGYRASGLSSVSFGWCLGTERCNEALEKLEKKYDVVVNIQGDEPLIEPEIIDGVVKALQVS